MIKISFEKRKKKKVRFSEYSKKALTAIITMWFFGAIFGCVAVAIQIYQKQQVINLSDVLMYIGTPMTGGVVAYMIKSATENVPKIKFGMCNDINNENEDII
jgi:multisubunit Na+/H+ antiporter MnhG subunit